MSLEPKRAFPSAAKSDLPETKYPRSDGVNRINPLPTDLLKLIFAFIPQEEQPPLSEVCKRWRALTCKTLTYKLPPTAVKLGSISLFLWCRERKIPISTRICSVAARAGNLPMLRELIGMRYPIGESTWLEAVRGEHLHVLRHLRQPQEKVPALACDTAAATGNLALLQWLRDRGAGWSKEACKAAARRGDLPMLQFLIANGCKLPYSILSFAALGRNLEMLKWLKAQGQTMDNSILSDLARGGSLEALQWALSEGSNWEVNDTDADCSYEAAAAGHLHILKWAHAKGHPLSSICFKGAANEGHFQILEWGHAESLVDWEMLCIHTMGRISLTKNYKTLKWACNKGFIADATFHRVLERFPKYKAIQRGSVLETIEALREFSYQEYFQQKKKEAFKDILLSHAAYLREMLSDEENIPPLQAAIAEACKNLPWRDWLLDNGFLYEGVG